MSMLPKWALDSMIPLLLKSYFKAADVWAGLLYVLLAVTGVAAHIRLVVLYSACMVVHVWQQ